MSVYNGERYLRKAIESILDQTFGNFEFIIVDDGSTDKSADIIRSYGDHRIRLFQQENRGLSAALNIGLKAAQGQYIARMDADDVSLPHRFETQHRFLETHPSCVAVGSNAIVIDSEGNYLYTTNQPTEWEKIRRGLPLTPFYHSSTMFQRDTALKCGGYYEGIKHYFEDVIFFNKLATMGILSNIEAPLVKCRILPSSLTNRDQKYYREVIKITKNVLRTDSIAPDDLKVLDKITSEKSKRWKESNYHLRIGKIFLEYNFHRRKAIRNFLLSIGKYPFNGISWFNLFLSLLPRRVIHRWRGWRNRRYDEGLREGSKQ
jgi:glycosyltransferase involved in cell wall biosynthesis